MSDATVESRTSRRPAWDATIGESADAVSPDGELVTDQSIYVAPARYALGALLGRGARGQVFVAHDRQLDREVAVKFLAHEHVRDGHKLASFIREARVTARLEHSSILPVHELEFTAQGEPYFTMRVARGMTLGAAIRQAAAGDPPAEIRHVSDRLAVFMRVCDALAYAHDQGSSIAI